LRKQTENWKANKSKTENANNANRHYSLAGNGVTGLPSD
jgi:hypothetical protein